MPHLLEDPLLLAPLGRGLGLVDRARLAPGLRGAARGRPVEATTAGALVAGASGHGCGPTALRGRHVRRRAVRRRRGRQGRRGPCRHRGAPPRPSCWDRRRGARDDLRRPIAGSPTGTRRPGERGTPRGGAPGIAAARARRHAGRRHGARHDPGGAPPPTSCPGPPVRPTCRCPLPPRARRRAPTAGHRSPSGPPEAPPGARGRGPATRAARATGAACPPCGVRHHGGRPRRRSSNWGEPDGVGVWT